MRWFIPVIFHDQELWQDQPELETGTLRHHPVHRTLQNAVSRVHIQYVVHKNITFLFPTADQYRTPKDICETDAVLLPTYM